MVAPIGSITVNPGSLSLSVTITGGPVYTSLDGTTQPSFPATVSTPTTYYTPYGQYTVTSTFNGVTIDTSSFLVDRGTAKAVTPTIESAAEFAALLATYAARPHGANSIVTFGDSLIAHDNGTSGSTTASSIRGIWTWANMFLNHRFDLLHNAGVSGNHVEDMQARITTDVLAYNPAWCLVEGGVNNATSNDATYIETQLLAIYTILVANGIRPIATTITPNDGTNSTGFDTIYAVNHWIKQTLPHLIPGIVVVDWAAAVTKPVDGHWGSTGAGRSLTYDGLHPASQGAAWLGKVLANSLAPFVPARDLHIRSNINKNGLGPNPGMTGTGASKGSGVTGTGPDSWTVSAASGSVTSVLSQPTRTDFVGAQALSTTTDHGLWCQMATSANSGSIRALFNNDNVGTDWNIGDEVYAQIEYQADSDFDPTVTIGAASASFILTLLAQTAGSAATLLTATAMLAAGDVIFPSSMFQTASGVIYTLKTPSIVIPSTSARLRVQLQHTGTGTVRFASGTIIKGSSPV